VTAAGSETYKPVTERPGTLTVRGIETVTGLVGEGAGRPSGDLAGGGGLAGGGSPGAAMQALPTQTPQSAMPIRVIRLASLSMAIPIRGHSLIRESSDEEPWFNRAARSVHEVKCADSRYLLNQ
jgi:hypothetical protein